MVTYHFHRKRIYIIFLNFITIFVNKMVRCWKCVKKEILLLKFKHVIFARWNFYLEYLLFYTRWGHSGSHNTDSKKFFFPVKRNGLMHKFWIIKKRKENSCFTLEYYVTLKYTFHNKFYVWRVFRKFDGKASWQDSNFWPRIVI